MVDRGRIELPTEACKATVFPVIPTARIRYTLLISLYSVCNGEFGGDEWNRATNLLRMKELHYRCATSPNFGAGKETRTLNPFGTGF